MPKASVFRGLDCCVLWCRECGQEYKWVCRTVLVFLNPANGLVVSGCTWAARLAAPQ